MIPALIAIPPEHAIEYVQVPSSDAVLVFTADGCYRIDGLDLATLEPDAVVQRALSRGRIQGALDRYRYAARMQEEELARVLGMLPKQGIVDAAKAIANAHARSSRDPARTP